MRLQGAGRGGLRIPSIASNPAQRYDLFYVFRLEFSRSLSVYASHVVDDADRRWT